MKRRFALKAACAALAVSGLVAFPALAADTIKVGILHSLSGTMAICETVAEGRRADDDRRDQRQGRRPRQASSKPVVVDPASNWPLFAEKAKQLHHAGQGRGGLRLLDVSVSPQVRAAGVRKEQRPALLSGPVRRRRVFAERVLHRRGAESAGDSGGRVPDEQGRRWAKRFVPARHRLRLSAHDQQDPARLPARQGHHRRRHHGGVHAVRPQRLPDDHRQDQEVSPRARRRRSSRRSTATRTCRSTRSSATRA